MSIQKKIIPAILLILFPLLAAAQNYQTVTVEEYLDNRDALKGRILMATVEDGDTNLFIKIKPIIIFPPRKFAGKKQQQKYDKLVRRVKKMYPYAQEVKQVYNETELVLMTMDNRKDQKRYLDKKEKELQANFEDDIRNMTFSEGKVLIKLIDRETGQTSYELIKHFKGNISAVLWQSVARVFSTDLKYDFDAKGEDAWIEEIVSKIENGLL